MFWQYNNCISKLTFKNVFQSYTVYARDLVLVNTGTFDSRYKQKKT